MGRQQSTIKYELEIHNEGVLSPLATLGPNKSNQTRMSVSSKESRFSSYPLAAKQLLVTGCWQVCLAILGLIFPVAFKLPQ